ncbi:MAG: hypothetical protein VB119_06970 [Candidatus Metalachnospira sp.]|nr:hypothetical protein [Candidatus Metalachnospira sp.]
MAEKYVDIAKQSTSDEINNKLGNTDDVGGSSSEGTTSAKLNANLLKTDGLKIDIDNLNARLDGQATPYGMGTYGDLVLTEDFVYPSLDGFNRYVIHTDSFIVPEGMTMRPPAKCDGLYILSKGDVTVNGIIDLQDIRKTFGSDSPMSPTINIGDVNYALAKGGYSPLGGACGSGGNTQYGTKTATPAPSIAPINSIAGNINGGGIGQYGDGGRSSVLSHYSDDDGESTTVVDYDYVTKFPNGTAVLNNPELLYEYHAPGALVIIASGKVTINGQVLANAQEGVNAQDGGTTKGTVFNGSGTSYYYTVAGNGAIPPSGGGPVTIICSELIMNGLINTKGAKLISPDGVDHSDKTLQELGSDTGFAAPYVRGSNGGEGGTFISTPGEIKVYETGGVA